MKPFFQTRVRLHQKNIQRYLKYVFNDHFALSMMILVGAIGLYYSNALKTLPPDFKVGGFFVLIIWLGALHIGEFTTLTKPADNVFLLPKELQMRSYLAQAFRYSCYFPFGLLVLIGGAMMPLLVVANSQDFLSFFFYLLMLWGLKISQLEVQRMALFQDMEKATKNAYLLWEIIAVGTLALSIFLFPWLGMLLAIVQISLFHNLCWQKMHALLDWEKMIAKEQHRLHRMYRFINLFTDVPEITAQVKRRKYLDVLLSRISYDTNHTYLYLYARRLLRGTEYSGLYLRLTAIGCVLLAFSEELWLAVSLGGLFLYLIGFQLLPLYQQFQYMVTPQMYPVNPQQKLAAIQKIVGLLLILSAVLFSFVSCFVLSNWGERAIVSGVLLVIAVLFTQLYLPYRIKRKHQS